MFDVFEFWFVDVVVVCDVGVVVDLVYGVEMCDDGVGVG